MKRSCRYQLEVEKREQLKGCWVCAGKARCMCNECLIWFFFGKGEGGWKEEGERKKEEKEEEREEEEEKGRRKGRRNHHRLCCCSGMAEE